MLKRLIKSAAHSPRTYRLVDRAETLLPPLRIWHRAQYDRHFQKSYSWERLFSGVYPTFADALAHIPRNRPIGYDNPEAATFLTQHNLMLPCEYPVIFHLSRLLAQQPTPALFDFGGYLALTYKWYRPYEIIPDGLRWTIYDVPAVVAAGEKMLQEEPIPGLSFTTDLTQAAQAQIFYASGALHFEERSLATMLQSLSVLPTHLLINKLPTTYLPTFYTLHNMGPAIAPYRVVNRSEFVTALGALGYELIDSWKTPELTAHIPFHPDHSVQAFEGMYLRRKS